VDDVQKLEGKAQEACGALSPAKRSPKRVRLVVSYANGLNAIISIHADALRLGDHVVRVILYQLQSSGLLPVGRIKTFSRR
jgi:hypothetical protein